MDMQGWHGDTQPQQQNAMAAVLHNHGGTAMIGGNAQSIITMQILLVMIFTARQNLL